MIKLILPEPPGDQRKTSIFNDFSNSFPSSFLSLPLYRWTKSGETPPKAWSSSSHCRFKQVLNFSLLLDYKPIQPCVFSLQILDNLFSPHKFFSCFFSRILSWTSFLSTMWLFSFLLIFPTVSTATCLKMANTPLTHFYPLRNTLKILAAQIIKNEQSL